MKRACILVLGVFTAVILGFNSADATDGDDYFESKFDGVWYGYMTSQFAGQDMIFFISMNLNVQGNSGAGFGVGISPDPTYMLVATVHTILSVTAKGIKITLTADLNEPLKGDPGYFPIIVKARMKLQNGVLTGKTIPEKGLGYSKGKAELYPADENKPVHGVWFGYSKDVPVGMHLVQMSPVNGSALMGMDYGVLTNGEFDGKNLTGAFATAGGLSEVNMKLKKGKLKGKIKNTSLGNLRPTLLPVGTNAKTPVVKSVLPKSVAAVAPAAETELTIKGKNFANGSVVHFDDPGIEITGIEFVNAKEMKVTVLVDAGVAAGTKIGVRVVNADFRMGEKDNAFSIK